MLSQELHNRSAEPKCTQTTVSQKTGCNIEMRKRAVPHAKEPNDSIQKVLGKTPPCSWGI
jgi:hypothetical protein